jgi:hypothetical protein
MEAPYVNLDFDLLRDVQDGDLIATRSNHGGLPALTRKITKSPFTHTAVVIRLDDRAWVAEMGAGGNHLVPLNRYAHSQLDVLGFPGDRGLVRANTLESLQGRIKYDWMDLLRIAAFNLLHLRLPRTDKGGMVCSAYSAMLWLGAGVRLVLPSLPSPGEVVAAARDAGAALLYRRSDAG